MLDNTYMLDTNVCSELMRERQRLDRPVLAKLTACRARICISAIVEAELLYGLDKHPSERRTLDYQWLCSVVTILPLHERLEWPRHYAAMRVSQERRGEKLDPMDLLIASHAKAVGAVLVSDDRAFTRIPDLALENWLMSKPECASAGAPPILREAPAPYGDRVIETPIARRVREVAVVSRSWGAARDQAIPRDRAKAANFGSLLAVS